MYKAFQSNNYYLALETFPLTAKSVSRVYITGIRNFESGDMKTYSVVLYRFRIMLGIKKPHFGDCPG